MTQAEATWSPPPVSLHAEAFDEFRVTVEPTTAMIARKQFDQRAATDISFDLIAIAEPPETSTAEFDLAEQTRLNKPAFVREASPPQAITLPRQAPESSELHPALVQPPKSLGTDRVAPSFTNSPPPIYPAVAIQNKWEGTVLLRIQINADGTVAEVEVARSSGYPVIDGAAVNAVRRWSGTPATQDGREVATVELLPIRFKLRD